MKTAAEPSFQSAFRMRYRILFAVLFLVPGAVPLCMYALRTWNAQQAIRQQQFGTFNVDYGLISQASGKVVGLWPERWANGPFADPFGAGLVLSPVDWGWIVLAATLTVGVVMAMYALRFPGVIPHRSSLRGWATESADHERRFAAARTLVAWRVLAIWMFAAPTCAAALSIWLVQSDGGEQLGNPLRVLLVTVMAASATFAISVLAGARWARRDALRMCSACIDCGYPRPALGDHVPELQCSECGARGEVTARRRLHPAAHASLVTACWIVPWITLGWMAFNPRPAGGAWIPYDSPRVIHLESGHDVFVLVHRTGPADLPAPGSRSFDVRFTLELRCGKDRQVQFAQRDRVLHFSGNHAVSWATDHVYLIDHTADATPERPGSRVRVSSHHANDHCVMLLTSVAIVGITEVKVAQRSSSPQPTSPQP